MSNRITQMLIITGLLCCILAGCAGKQTISSQSSGNPMYEKQKIVFEGEIEGTREITVSEMRQLPQREIEASFQRTTGLMETFRAAGPALNDVMSHVGIDSQEFKGIGVVGKDDYYCLLTPEVLKNHDLILALSIDRKSELPTDLRPARLCAPGEFGPYWVRMVDKIILYKQIPRKDIASVWVFYNLAQGIEPYPYEYYGSKDDAIELAQIFSRFDNVNNKAFFTMKSSDGFTKNEALNMVSKRYYIKIAGQDAPMNMAPNIKLGMNVKHIAWLSTNADAAVFPKEMAELIDVKENNGIKGIALHEMLEEVQLRDIEEKQFEVMGVNGESVKLSGHDLSKGLLLVKDDGTYPVVWQNGTEFQPVSNLLRIRSLQ
ncbi:MAG: molybdopterin-dependent oxidoreductase [Syntrophomonadaceae bacterium]|nr:molybdopterin-dependent oxidoreductase [Syntrophomonadaceae bacterium]